MQLLTMPSVMSERPTEARICDQKLPASTRMICTPISCAP
jgi:hypothetical protein